jgi:hypothetical protein
MLQVPWVTRWVDIRLRRLRIEIWLLRRLGRLGGLLLLRFMVMDLYQSGVRLEINMKNSFLWVV